jgi:hypothetical protein
MIHALDYLFAISVAIVLPPTTAISAHIFGLELVRGRSVSLGLRELMLGYLSPQRHMESE